MVLSWTDVAAKLFAVRFGRRIDPPAKDMKTLLRRIDKNSFADDLRACHRTPEGQRLLTITAVRNLLDSKKSPRNLSGKSLEFVHHYLKWISQSGRVAISQEVLYADLLDEIQKAVGLRPAGGAKARPASGLMQSRFFEYVFDKVVESSEERDIFLSHAFNADDTSKILTTANTAYYVAFRYSTVSDRILKSFVAVLTPQENKLGFFSFVHAVKGDPSRNKLKKVTRGLVLNLPPGTYFLGKTIRSDSKIVSNFEMLAIERETFLTQGPVVHALLMTSAAVNQPVVSRLVLVRIGDRLSLGRKLQDKDIDATEFGKTQLQIVVKDLVGRCAELGAEDQIKTTSSETLDEHAMKLEKLIWEGINNIPRPMLARLERESLMAGRYGSDPIADGALEVWGREPRP